MSSMGTSFDFQDGRVLSVETQVLNMKMEAGIFKIVKRVPGKSVVWRGTLQPSPLHKAYMVQIEYRLNRAPRITLPEEKFDERPPHTFADYSLCLYNRRGIGAWRPDMPISRHLVPLITHWLWCYEMWLATDVWHGEEFDHGDAPKEPN